jgi:hypothetical protein
MHSEANTNGAKFALSLNEGTRQSPCQKIFDTASESGKGNGPARGTSTASATVTRGTLLQNGTGGWIGC